jgi:hypothetical protein
VPQGISQPFLLVNSPFTPCPEPIKQSLTLSSTENPRSKETNTTAAIDIIKCNFRPRRVRG